MQDADLDGVLGLGGMDRTSRREGQTRRGGKPPAGTRSLRDRLH